MAKGKTQDDGAAELFQAGEAATEAEAESAHWQQLAETANDALREMARSHAAVTMMAVHRRLNPGASPAQVAAAGAADAEALDAHYRQAEFQAAVLAQTAAEVEAKRAEADMRGQQVKPDFQAMQERDTAEKAQRDNG